MPPDTACPPLPLPAPAHSHRAPRPACVRRYTITVYHCKYDTPFNNVAYVWNAQQYGAGAAARDACAASADNHYASVVSTKTTIASTNDKTSITYGCDAHRAQSRDGAPFSSPRPSVEPATSHAPPLLTVTLTLSLTLTLTLTRFATLESIITEEVTLADGGMGEP